MAKNGAKGSGRLGAIAARSQVQHPKTGRWTKRDSLSGRFVATKKSRGRFKGVRRER